MKNIFLRSKLKNYLITRQTTNFKKKQKTPSSIDKDNHSHFTANSLINSYSESFFDLNNTLNNNSQQNFFSTKSNIDLSKLINNPYHSIVNNNSSLNSSLYKNNLNASQSSDNLNNNLDNNIKDDNNILNNEIEQIKNDIKSYKKNLDNLTEEYSSLLQKHKNYCINNFSFEEMINNSNLSELDRELNNKLEEEKYNLKLQNLMHKNELIKQRNSNLIKHNQEMKKYYKIYTGKEWK